jgi:FtsP/CotA-like multicopper oxidase with cupredoxin domain
MHLRFTILAGALSGLSLSSSPAFAAGDNVTQFCARPAAGTVITEPPALYSRHGVLSVSLNYVTSIDPQGRTLYCFITPDGLESPTFHVRPGDSLDIDLRNTVPPAAAAMDGMVMSDATKNCTSSPMDASSVNMHFHGTNTSPTCHSDEVIHTVVNSGERYHYHIVFPADEPAGLYWYHPHIHGNAEGAVLGGASGAIVVDGIESIQPAVGGLPTRVLIIRDQNVAGNPMPGGKVPAWDVTLNYVPNAWPKPVPGVIVAPPGRKEFWRVLNASADTVADVALKYDRVDQPIGIVALDGVATGSHDGTEKHGKVVTASHFLIPPAGRVEFIMTMPPAHTSEAVFETRRVDTGPIGDNDTLRTLAVIDTSRSRSAAVTERTPMPFTSAAAGGERFAGLLSAPVTARRQLHFSEVLSDPNNPLSPTNFYITVNGAKRELFSANHPPAIVTTRGSVEEWTIENRTKEVHEFHIHQIHFLLMAQNGVPVRADQRQFRDTLQVPYWSGSGPYPNVKVLMDFRGPVTGDFVYHCHILGHEDNGMMAIIRVLPRG